MFSGSHRCRAQAAHAGVASTKLVLVDVLGEDVGGYVAVQRVLGEDVGDYVAVQTLCLVTAVAAVGPSFKLLYT